MSAQNPRQFDELFAKAFNGGDVDGLVAMYEQGATLILPPGVPVTGHEAIREAMAGFLALGGRLELRTAAVVDSGDVALVYSDWLVAGATGPDGNPLELAGRSTVVLRKQGDGSWLAAIDDPRSSG